MHKAPSNARSTPLSNLTCLRVAVAALVGAACLAGPGGSGAQEPASGKPVAPRARPVVVSKPEWKELSAAQQRALQPLAGSWHGLSEPHKRKWLAVSGNFDKLTSPEQHKLQERMTEWVALSPAQRNQARLNFAETKQLAPSEKQAKWQAYQALSEEDRQKLAQRAPKPPAGAATAVKPVARQKLANVPVDRPVHAPPTTDEAALTNPQPHILPVRKIDRNTLLPQQP